MTIFFIKDNQKNNEDNSKKVSSPIPEDVRTLTGFSLTWKFLLKNSVSPVTQSSKKSREDFKMESRPYVLNPKYSTPTSLPLYFYFVYQLLQETERLEECGPVSKIIFFFPYCFE